MINLPAGASEDARKAARAKADELDKLAVADPSSSPNWPARRTPAPPPMAATWAGSRGALPGSLDKPPSA